MQQVRMASVDAAWLQLERPDNPMVITAVLWFARPMDWEALRRVVRERLVARFPRFRDRAVPAALGLPSWEREDAFDLEAHLTWLRLPAPGTPEALQALVGRVMSTPLDLSLPPWHLHLVDGYGEGSAVVVRIHHCIADGISLSRVLLTLTDEAPGAVGFREEAPREEGRARGGWLGRAADTARRARTLVGRARGLLDDPDRLLGAARSGLEGVRTARRLATLRDDAPAFRGPLSTTKRAVWCPPLPLAQVKAIGRATGGTVNDVLMAALTGALRRYLTAHGREATELRAIIPVNLRPLEEPLPRELGNHFGLVFLPLPVELEEPRARLEEVRRRMDALKRSPEPLLSLGALAVAGWLPARAEQRLVELLSRRGSLLVTNVPGPRQPVWLAGTRVEGLMVWAPQAGEVGLGATLISYRGEVTLGLSADCNVLPDGEALLEAFTAELEVLATCAGVRRDGTVL